MNMKLCAIMWVGLVCSTEGLADTLSLNAALVNSSAAGIIDPTSTGTPGLTGALNAATGLGTITFTDTKQGAGFFDLFVDLSMATPFFNEYGLSAGTASASESWQIDVPDYWCNTPACRSIRLPFGSPDPNDPTANIIANTLTNTLNNHNGVPGTLGNYLNDCGAEPNSRSPAQNPACNNDVSLGIGFNYFVPPGSQEVISLTLSPTAPASGFYLEQLHPADPANPGGVSSVFLYGSAQLQTTSSVPEPSAVSLLTLAILTAAGICRGRAHSFAKTRHWLRGIISGRPESLSSPPCQYDPTPWASRDRGRNLGNLGTVYPFTGFARSAMAVPTVALQVPFPGERRAQRLLISGQAKEKTVTR